MGIETVIAGITAGAAAKSAFSGDKGGSSTSVATDPRQMAMYEDLYNRSKGIAGQPFVPYTGARVAGFNPDQLRGFDQTRSLFDRSMEYNPMTGLNDLANQQAPSLLNTDISAYQNPFNEQVINQSLNDLDRERQIR